MNMGSTHSPAGANQRDQPSTSARLGASSTWTDSEMSISSMIKANLARLSKSE